MRAKIGIGFVGGALVLGVVGYELKGYPGAFLGIAAAAAVATLIGMARIEEKSEDVLTRLQKEGLTAFYPHKEMMRNLKSVLKREDYLGLVIAGRETDATLSRYTLDTRYGKVNLSTSPMCLYVESFTNFQDCPGLDSKVAEDVAHKIGIQFFTDRYVQKHMVFQSRVVVAIGDKVLSYNNWEHQIAARALQVTTAESILRDYLQEGVLSLSAYEKMEKLHDLPKELKLYH